MKKMISCRKSLSILATVVLAFALIPHAWGAQKVWLNGNAVDREFDLRVVESGPDRIVVAFTLNALEFDVVSTPQGDFAALGIGDYGFTSDVGKARMPLVRETLQIPFGAEPRLTVTRVRTESYTLGQLGIFYPLIPAQEPIDKHRSRHDYSDFVVDDAFYSTDAFYPSAEQIAALPETGIMRAYRFVTMDLKPVRYNPVSSELLVAREIELEITLPGADLELTKRNAARYYSPSFENLARNIFPNFDPVITGLPSAPIGYVVVVADDFAGNQYLDAYLDWKSEKGFYVDYKTVSQLGGTANSIKAYIQDEYFNGAIPPAYILLVGDKEWVPAFTGSRTYKVTDQHYTRMTQGDYFSDLEVGRFSARNASDIAVFVDKSLDYEKFNYTDEHFADHATFIASDDPWFWNIAEGTHEYVIDTHMTPNDIASVHIKGHSGGNTQDIKDALNYGCMVCNYSGHGSNTSWGGPSFTISNINSLTNEGMYPFVISNACNTGNFSVSECMGEAWINASQKGALAFLGSAPSSYWDEDDWYERQLYDAFFWYGYYTIYGMNIVGNYSVYLHGSGKAEYYHEAYNILGDPSHVLWFGVPRTADVSCAGIPEGATTAIVGVSVGGTPEAGALVGAYQDGVLRGAAYTDGSGVAVVPLDPPADPGTMLITVTGVDLRTYQENVDVGGSRLVNVELTPEQTQIPRTGILRIDAQVTNTSGDFQTFDVWSFVVLPDGSTYGPLVNETITLGPREFRQQTLEHYVPSNAPLGGYIYRGYAGNFPTEIWDADQFSFQVTNMVTGSDPDTE